MGLLLPILVKQHRGFIFAHIIDENLVVQPNRWCVIQYDICFLNIKNTNLFDKAVVCGFQGFAISTNGFYFRSYLFEYFSRPLLEMNALLNILPCPQPISTLTGDMKRCSP